MKAITSSPISASQRTARGGFTVLELLVVIAIIGVLAALFLPVMSRAKSKARNAVCLNQLRQLGIATRLYADENGNRLPAAELLPSDPVEAQNPLPRISDLLAETLGQKGGTNATANVFRCPEDKLGRFVKEGSSYEWNIDLNGHRLDETRSTGVRIIKDVVINGQPVEQSDERKTLLFPPSSTPLLLDYEDFHPRPPKPGKNVVYMDGHTTGFEVPVEDATP